LFYGASSDSLRDPFGHVWILLTWKEDLEPAEMERRGNRLLNPLGGELLDAGL
jgi:PhnB protein